MNYLTEKPVSNLHGFPLSGKCVAEELMMRLPHFGTCVINDIETLCSNECEDLGLIWNKVNSGHNLIMELEDFLPIISQADQVIILDLHLLDASDKRLFIEDGSLILSTL